jgi:hypothetical protein
VSYSDAVFSVNNAIPFPQYMNIMHSTDGLHTRMFIARWNTVTGIFMLENAVDADSGLYWTIPWILLNLFTFGYGASSDRATRAVLQDIANIKTRIGAVDTSLFCSSEGYASQALTERIVRDDLTGDYPMIPIGLVSETVGTRGKRGRLQDIWFGTPRVSPGYTYPIDNSRKFIQLGEVIMPWNGSILQMANW